MLCYKVKETRIQKGLTQEQLARLSGISASMICAIENNYRNPTVLVLHELAKAMKVHVNDLYEEVRISVYCQ